MSDSSDERPIAAPKRKSLASNTAIMGLGTLISRVTGFGRVIALAYALGAERLADSYTLANNIPNVIYELVIGGVLSATLVPVFANRFKSRSEKEAWYGVSAIATLTMVMVIAAAFLVFLTAPFIVHIYSVFSTNGTSAGGRDTATFLLRWFAPQVAFYGFISIATAVLQARRRFAPPMFAPILNNVVVIAMFLSLPHVVANPSLDALADDRWALMFLGIGTTAGVGAMAAYIVPSYLNTVGRNIRIVFDWHHEAVRTVLRMSGWTLGLVITNQVAMWITLALSFSDHTGSTAIYLTAYTFFILPHGIFSVSLMNALQPELAEHWAIRDIHAFRAQTNLGLRLIFLVLFPVVIGFVVLAHPLLIMVLHHGNMSLDKVHLTADVAIAMMIGVPGFSAFIFLTRVFQSMQDARTVFYLYLVENGINIATALPLFFLGGVRGLALSQSIAYSFAAVLALLVLRSRINRVDGDRLLRSLGRQVIPLGAMLIALVIPTIWLADHPLIQVSVAVLSGGIVFVGLAYALRLPELQLFLGRFASRGSRTNPPAHTKEQHDESSQDHHG